jgi:hypothetical protein
MHWHRHDYIYVMFGQSEVVNAVQAKAPVPINLQDAQVGFTPGPFAHIVRNQDHPFRNVTIELLQDAQLHHSTHKWDEDRGLDILQGGTKQILWVKDAVRATEFELQPGGSAPISDAPTSSSPSLISNYSRRNIMAPSSPRWTSASKLAKCNGSPLLTATP